MTMGLSRMKPLPRSSALVGRRISSTSYSTWWLYLHGSTTHTLKAVTEQEERCPVIFIAAVTGCYLPGQTTARSSTTAHP